MKQFTSFVKKEFLHVLRDPRTLLVLFGMPVAQILIFGFALSGDISDAPVMIVDQAHDPYSRRLISEIDASSYFSVMPVLSSPRQIAPEFKKGAARIALVISADFARRLHHPDGASLQLITDATDPNYATTLENYLSAVFGDFRSRIDRAEPAPYQINTRERMLYNPGLRKQPSLVPGIISLILMLICVMMTAVSIVREKETGTLELLLVSPFKPSLIIVAKTIPFLLLSLVNMVSILILSIWMLHVPVKGSLALLLAESLLFIITCLSLGILISVKVATQQVALLISLLAMLLPTILFSGFLFPIANMPAILRAFTDLVPSKWYYLITQSIMVKGLGWGAVWKQTLVLSVMAAFFVFVSLKNFKTRLQ